MSAEDFFPSFCGFSHLCTHEEGWLLILLPSGTAAEYWICLLLSIGILSYQASSPLTREFHNGKYSALWQRSQNFPGANFASNCLSCYVITRIPRKLLKWHKKFHLNVIFHQNIELVTSDQEKAILQKCCPQQMVQDTVKLFILFPRMDFCNLFQKRLIRFQSVLPYLESIELDWKAFK